MNRREMLKQSVIGAAITCIGAPAFIAGCTEQQVATWIQLGLNLIATVLPTLPGILGAISTLTGKTIPDTVAANLTKQFTNIQSLFQTVQADIKAYQSNPDPSLITKIQGVITQIQTDLGAVLADLSISDPATVTHIKAVVASLSLLASNILAILPIVTNGKVQARKVSKARVAQLNSKTWATEFNTSVHTKTENAEVDSVFETVKAEAK